MSGAMVLGPGEGEVLSVVGERIRILADSARTRGACVVFENISPPGGGPPMHRHGRDDELFFVVEGTVRFSIDGHESVVGPGGSAYAPRGSVHTFVNAGSTPSRMVITCCPGGIEGPFRAVDKLERNGKATPDAVVAAFGAFDLAIVGAPLAV